MLNKGSYTGFQILDFHRHFVNSRVFFELLNFARLLCDIPISIRIFKLFSFLCSRYPESAKICCSLPCNRLWAWFRSCSLADVVVKVCVNPVLTSTPIWAFSRVKTVRYHTILPKNRTWESPIIRLKPLKSLNMTQPHYGKSVDGGALGKRSMSDYRDSLHYVF